MCWIKSDPYNFMLMFWYNSNSTCEHKLSLLIKIRSLITLLKKKILLSV
jgi:hypothetical protein